MPKLRVHNIAISLDGYAAGPDQSLDNPLGVGGRRLHEWAFRTRTFRRKSGQEDGETGLDDEFVALGETNIGATVMGRNMFGPIRGPWRDESWKGWWGDEPPYRHPGRLDAAAEGHEGRHRRPRCDRTASDRRRQRRRRPEGKEGQCDQRCRAGLPGSRARRQPATCGQRIVHAGLVGLGAGAKAPG